MTHTCDPSPWEAETGGPIWGWTGQKCEALSKQMKGAGVKHLSSMGFYPQYRKKKKKLKQARGVVQVV
jgi:hypothetical protein